MAWAASEYEILGKLWAIKGCRVLQGNGEPSFTLDVFPGTMAIEGVCFSFLPKILSRYERAHWSQAPSKGTLRSKSKSR